MSARQIAGKVASVLNGGECVKCHRPVDGGAWAISYTGSDPRWYPSVEDADARSAGPRFVFAAPDQPLDLDEVVALIEAQRDHLEQHLADIARLREERAWRRQETASRRGLEHRASCQQCGRFKRSPAERCEHCGDEPVSHNGDEHEFNRAYGFAS